MGHCNIIKESGNPEYIEAAREGILGFFDASGNNIMREKRQFECGLALNNTVEKEFIEQFDLLIFCLYPKVFIEWIRNYQQYIKPNDLYLNMNALSRQYFALSDLCTNIKNRYKNLIYLCFPEYETIFKGEMILDDEPNFENAINKLNCRLGNIVKFKLPIEESNRSLIKIIKEKSTSKLFPRKYSEIKKKPL